MQNETIRKLALLSTLISNFSSKKASLWYILEKKEPEVANTEFRLSSNVWHINKQDGPRSLYRQPKTKKISLSFSLNVRTKIFKSSAHRTEFGFRNKCLLECVWQPIVRFHNLWSAADPLPANATSPHSNSLLNPRPQTRWIGALDYFRFAALKWKKHKPSETLTATLIRCFTRLSFCDTTCWWKKPPPIATDCWWFCIDSEAKRSGVWRTCTNLGGSSEESQKYTAAHDEHNEEAVSGADAAQWICR